MITTNGRLLLVNQRLLDITSGIRYVDIDNEVVTQGYGGYAYAYKNCIRDNLTYPISSSSVNDAQGMCLNLGVGDAAETADDYTLDNMLVDGVDVNTIVTCQYSTYKWNAFATDAGTLVMQYTFRNTGSAPITVKELGLFYVNKTMKILCARKVIPPRTIQPSETVTFAYELDFC